MTKTSVFSTLSALLCSVLFAGSVWAKLPSTVEGLPMANAHEVVPGKVYRGGQPGKQTPALIKFGITDVIIIKTDTKGEVAAEVESLKSLGLTGDRVQVYDVEWKDVVSEPKNCKRFVKALKSIRNVMQESDRRVYFHCTVGEDRTGLLAGLIRMLEDQWSAKDAFENEMCAHGYADGRGKPANVAFDVKVGLTPTFVKLSSAIESGEMSWENLDEKICNGAADPSQAQDWVCP